MELRDYLLALRRYWTTWVGVVLAGLVVALTVVGLSPRVYEATAQVFVSSSTEGASPQFVSQRVKSYPDVAVSAAVLSPASDRLPSHPPLSELRASVSATNPADTSQITIVASSGDPETAAAVADAVAAEFADVVEELEQSASGRSPVSLTVTNPATPPTDPASPQTLFLLVLGTVLGLFLGAAAAIVRSRIDTRVHDARDVHDAWGADDVTVLVATGGRRRTATPAAALARRLESRAEDGPVRLAVFSPAPAEQAAARALATEVVAELTELGMAGDVSDSPAGTGSPGVHLQIADPAASLRGWRVLAAGTDAVVLVLPAGRVDAAELRETRTVLDEAGLRTQAVVVTPRPTRSQRRAAAAPPATPPASAPLPVPRTPRATAASSR